MSYIFPFAYNTFVKSITFGHGIDRVISQWTTEQITNNKENCEGLVSEFIGYIFINLSEL